LRSPILGFQFTARHIGNRQLKIKNSQLAPVGCGAGCSGLVAPLCRLGPKIMNIWFAFHAWSRFNLAEIGQIVFKPLQDS